MWPALLYAAVAVGVGLRLLRWLDNPGLWMDEAFLSINLLDKSFTGIFGQLQFLQSAPPAFLLVQKSVESIVGDAEWALRLFPLVMSVVSVLLVAYSARRLLSPPAAVLAVALFATTEPTLLRVADVKHYSTDIAVAIMLVALYLWAVDVPRERRSRRLVALAIACPLAVAFSFAAVFTIGGVVVALAVQWLETRSRQALTAAVATAVLALVSSGAVFALAASNLRHVSASILGTGGDQNIAVGHLRTIKNAWWMFKDPGGFDLQTNSLAALLAGFALFALWKRGSLDRFALLFVPFVLAAAADAIHRYPLGGRFSFFLVPLLMIVVARGAQALTAWSRQPLVVGVGVAIFLAGPLLAIAAYQVRKPDARSDVTPLLQHLAKSWRTGDALYVYPDAQYQLRYYTECKDCSISGKSFPWPSRLAPPGPPGEQYAPALESVPPTVEVGSRGNPNPPLGDLTRLPKTGRVWLLFSTSPLSHNGLDDENLIVWTLEKQGKLLEELRTRGAQLYLIDRRAGG